MSAYTYNPKLLEHFLNLDQGGKIQAECTLLPLSIICTCILIYDLQTFGSMVMVVSATKLL